MPAVYVLLSSAPARRDINPSPQAEEDSIGFFQTVVFFPLLRTILVPIPTFSQLVTRLI